MDALYLVLIVLVGVSSASVAEERSDPYAASAYAPVETPQYAYSSPQQYRPNEPNLIQIIKGSLASLFTLDAAILGLTIAGVLLILSTLGLINLAPIIAFLQSVFPILPAGRSNKSSPIAKAAHSILGKEVDRVSEIVNNAIDNIEMWNSF